MSADNDSTSTTRRRLFKALAAAPVVTTLKPGAALANSSAFQCAQKIVGADEPNLLASSYGPLANLNSNSEGFLYVLLPYLDLQTSPPPGCYGGTLPTGTRYVVAVENAGAYDLYSDVAPGQALAAARISYDGTVFSFFNGGGQPCQETRQPLLGYFALFYAAGDDYATGTPWPKANPSSGSDLQGMTGTCLASVNPDAASALGISRG
jgi:hypothetical protein